MGGLHSRVWRRVTEQRNAALAWWDQERRRQEARRRRPQCGTQRAFAVRPRPSDRSGVMHMCISMCIPCVMIIMRGPNPSHCPYQRPFGPTVLPARDPWQTEGRTAPPRWAELDETTQQAFTRCGRYANDTDLFVDDSESGAGTAYGYSERDIAALAKRAATVVDIARRKGATAVLYETTRRPPRPNDVYFLEALIGHVEEGASVLVVGSAEPWHEAICLALGASRITTVDYGSRTYEHPLMEQVGATSFWGGLETNGTAPYDVVVTASALDHDGLGRYGDPISPDADILTMQALLRALAPGALVILSVPVGPDRIIWNLMRVYSRDRLPRLLDGYEVVARIGYDEERVDAAPENVLATYEPAFVLRVPADICLTGIVWCDLLGQAFLGYSISSLAPFLATLTPAFITGCVFLALAMLRDLLRMLEARALY